MSKSMMSRIRTHEIAFQVFIHVILFVFIAFDKREPEFYWDEVAFFLSYAIGAFVINYILLPKYYYQKQYWKFVIWIIIVIVALIAIEELVLEQIFFPDTRAKYFPGFFYSLADVLPAVVILSGFKFAWDATMKQREVDQLQSLVEESELQFLKSQINPHFLFNNLNNIYALALENSKQTPDMILELSSVLRYILYDCDTEYVALSKELDHLKSFTALYEQQVQGTAQIDIKTSTGLWQIAPLLLSVFVENAFKHSSSSMADQVEIDMYIEVNENGLLTFRCVNNYEDNSNLENLPQGIGLDNVRKRLELLYPNQHELDITQVGGQFTINLTLQLTKSAQ